MAELAFPIAGALLLVLVAIPGATLLCKGLLWALARLRPGLARAGSAERHLLIVLPVLVPVGWLISAASHHAEEGQAALTCLLDHVSDESCTEPLILLSLLSLAVGAVVVRGYRLATRGIARRRPLDDGALAERLARMGEAHPAIAQFRARTVVVDGDDLRTVGVLRPRVEIGRSAALRLDDAALAAGVHHELEHLRGRNPLRIVLAGICQALNPLSALLAPELARWRAGRELGCDEGAVHRGADPLALAEALVALSRPLAPQAESAAHLGLGGGIALVRLRVSLLLDYARAPARCRSATGATKTAAALLVAVAVLPHLLDAWPLGDLHHQAEALILRQL